MGCPTKQEWKRANNLVPLDLKGKVKLDVGGKKFFTTRAVLDAKKGFFRAVCEGVGAVEKDQEGCIFIDRSPAVFKHILNHMSNQPLPAELSEGDLEMLLIECEFYELEELSEMLGKKLPSSSGSSAVVAAKSSSLKNVDGNASVRAIADAIKADCAQRRKDFEQRKRNHGRLLAKINKTIPREKVRLQLQEESHVFSTTVETLKSKPGVLEVKFSHEWQGDVDEDGSVFINKDGSTFDIVLNLLRGYPMPFHLNKHERESLASDLEYFGLEGQFEPPKPAVDSEILAGLPNGAALLETLRTWLAGKSIGKCLYRDTRDGRDAQSFHQLCDNQGPTLVLVRSANGYVFGGAAMTSWVAEAGWVNSPANFIFTLTNPHNIAPTKFSCTDPATAMACNTGSGPIFGAGYDIRVSLIADGSGCHTAFPYSYGSDTTGKGDALFTGTRDFTLNQCEVLQLE